MNIYILLHGLFFLEYQSGDVLYVTTPYVPDRTIPPPRLRGHDYRMGNPEDGTNLRSIPRNTIINWTNKLQGGSENGFRDQMLQFHKSAAGTGNINNNFAFRIILPAPIEIFPLRRGNRDDFPVVKTGKVWKSITNPPPRSPKMALVTCLQYHGDSDPSGSNTNRCHFYAEGDCPENVPEANYAYQETEKMFSTGFDLRLKVGSPTPTTVRVLPPAVDDPRLVDLQGKDQDEASLAELLAGTVDCTPQFPMEGVNVANCGQFGVLP